MGAAAAGCVLCCIAHYWEQKIVYSCEAHLTRHHRGVRRQAVSISGQVHLKPCNQQAERQREPKDMERLYFKEVIKLAVGHVSSYKPSKLVKCITKGQRKIISVYIGLEERRTKFSVSCMLRLKGLFTEMTIIGF